MAARGCPAVVPWGGNTPLLLIDISPSETDQALKCEECE